MAADLARTPSSGIHTQLCGDAHVSNFGAFAAPDRSLVFDMNDFDETLPGPWEWDLKRLAASYAIAGRERGFDAHERRRVALATTRAYRRAIRDFASMRSVDVWYARLDVEAILRHWRSQAGAARRRTVQRNVDKARTKDSLKAFAKLTHLVDGQPRIRSDPPLLVPIEELLPDDAHLVLEDELRRILRDYRRTLQSDRRRLIDRYRLVHVARKVVGVGSVGTRAWIALLLGRDHTDPLFLQIKEASSSVLEPYTAPPRARTHGQRVVDGQRLMQATGDIFLGWLRATGPDGEVRDFYVRQLWDSKGSVDLERIDVKTMAVSAEICGWTLARGHARSGDAEAIAGYAGRSDRLDRAIADFAEAYADQNERDYAAVAGAVRAGRLTAEHGL